LSSSFPLAQEPEPERALVLLFFLWVPQVLVDWVVKLPASAPAFASRLRALTED